MQAKHDQSATITKGTLKGRISFKVPAHPSQTAFDICQVRKPLWEQLLFQTDVQKQYLPE